MPGLRARCWYVVKAFGGILSLALALCCPSAAELPKGNQTLSAESQATYEKRVLPFLKKYCWQCHDQDSAKAGFQVDTLGTDFLAGKTADHWREAIDQINLGKMPKKGRPDPKEAFAVVEWVNQELRNAEKRAQSTGGRVPMRRLNRTEYANTVRDLFYLDENFTRTIERELPADGKVDGFDRGGAALFVDKAQLQAYLDMARLVVEEALPTAPPKVNKYHHEATKDTWLLRRADKKTTTLKEVLDRGDVQFSGILGKEKDQLPEIERGPEVNDFNVIRDGGLETSMSSNSLAYLETGAMLRQVVTRDGWYRFRIRAGANRGSGKFAADAVLIKADYCRPSKENRTSFTFTIDAPLDQPKVYEQTVFLRHGGASFERELTFTWNMYHPWGGFHDKDNTILPDPELFRLYWAGRQTGIEYTRALEKKEAPAVIEAARKKHDEARANLRQFALTFKGPVNHVNPEIDPKALPHLWFEYIELEGPLTDWPTKASKELFADGEKGDAAYARRIFAGFLPRAYRRPVSPEEVEAMVRVVQTMQDRRGKTLAEAVRDGLAIVLTSPHFLFLQEPTGADNKPHELTDHELASRLSYFLWSTMPDPELLELAAQKKVRDPGVLRAQVKRMIAHARARQFVESFAGQWLHARDFDSVMVDARQYKDYDDALRDSGLREPYEFFHELLRADRSVLDLLDSDFLVIDERLAKHYRIDGVVGDGFRRVPLKPEHRRGGLLGMAGLLTYLSDGTRTLPVKRGAYILDVLWNRPAPLPPPNVGDLPLIKDKNLTVRQRLEQHRSKASCASCHAKIDPLGLALENYDAIGAWRERQNGERRKGDKNDPPIDPAGVMPGGKAFNTLPEFKQILLEEKGKFLQGFTEKLLAYALGRPVGATDRELVEKIVAGAAKEDYHLQAFIQAIVASRAFQTR